jgi:hypothetical protein
LVIVKARAAKIVKKYLRFIVTDESELFIEESDNDGAIYLETGRRVVNVVTLPDAPQWLTSLVYGIVIPVGDSSTRGGDAEELAIKRVKRIVTGLVYAKLEVGYARQLELPF